MRLEGNKIYLRFFSYDDIEDLYEMCSEKETAYMAGWKPHRDRYITRNVITGYIYNGETLAICLKENDKVIGTISLYKEHFRKAENVRELGYCLNSNYRMKGYMGEAVDLMLDYGFNKLKLDMIFSCCQVYNFASRHVIESKKFKYEGMIRKYRTLYNGEIVDVYMYSLLKSEYLKEKENEGIKTEI